MSMLSHWLEDEGCDGEAHRVVKSDGWHLVYDFVHILGASECSLRLKARTVVHAQAEAKARWRGISRRHGHSAIAPRLVHVRRL